MKIRYEIYSSLLKEVEEIRKTVTKNFNGLTNSNGEILLGWKIGEVTVTLSKGKNKQEVKEKLTKAFNDKVSNQRIWLKEV